MLHTTQTQTMGRLAGWQILSGWQFLAQRIRAARHPALFTLKINGHVYLATIAVTFSVGLKSCYINLGYNDFDFGTRIFWLQYFHFGIPSTGSIFGLAEFKILGVIFIPYGVKTSNI